ncbi:cytochrome c precursor [Ameyamaea chiangmaiensis NBRC 103196]|uniref:Cytochrome c n=1 Tax=Ameyamaea chiangmaiensis TaxID=442969 RepID=A0A850P437_9PROT|nr:cytochrome c [Ameyamaea chiangmaiensis]MBS4074027.1 cytochrome c [Ameyamaea chiangmaiensis]NVN39417.1 cytochrome c [Ameyamaea chiangmaiensis]GBQ67526.1 cytochrome c precursor [Ameyamaea chiangmaiensis NBRC 103196]
MPAPLFRTSRLLPIVAAALCLAASPRLARADAAANVDAKSAPMTTGADVYRHVCQGCHMPDGKGAEGAGARFPAFAGNPKLADSGYPVYVVLNGFGGMPWFNGRLTDEQIANVVNYIRTSFGNHYTDLIKASDVAGQKPPVPTGED